MLQKGKPMSDLISRQDAINTSLEFFVEFLGGALHENAQKELIARFQRLSSAQPEITEEDIREWCYKRCLTIIDNALYLEMRSRWSASAQPERKKGHWKLLKNGDAICSECGFTQVSAWDMDGWDNFCQHCGSYNGGEQDE